MQKLIKSRTSRYIVHLNTSKKLHIQFLEYKPVEISIIAFEAVQTVACWCRAIRVLRKIAA